MPKIDFGEKGIRIYKRVNEDPGTAGNQEEENWRELLESWITPYF